MNTQEFINKLEEFKSFYEESTETFYMGKYEAYSTVLSLAEQIKIPQQPVVPKFVAEWYEKNKNDLHDKLFCEIATAGNVNEETTEFQHWLFNTPNCMNIVLNMKNGYEVEKEPLYIVSLPVHNEQMLAYDSVVEDYVIVDENFNDELGALRFELTEKEIKSKDERYWPFAVPVEKVTEG